MAAIKFDGTGDAISALEADLEKVQTELDREWKSANEMRVVLADCYVAMFDHYHEIQGTSEPADEWSEYVARLFVAIQRVTGLDHDTLMEDGSPVDLGYPRTSEYGVAR